MSLRNYLLGRGIACSVANITGNRKPDADEVYYPKSARELVGLLRSLEYDIVHTHIGGGLPARVLGLLLVTTLMPGRRAVLTFHSGGFPSSDAGKSARKRSFLGLVLRRLDAVIAVNPELVTLFRRVGVSDDRSYLIYPHSFGPELRALAERGRGGLGPALGTFFDTHDPVLLTVGLLEPEYDLGTQIAALGRLREQYPTAGLIVAGSGSLERDLRAQIAELGWGADVLLAGDVPREQTLAAMGACDVLLRTTLYDGDAISVREALCIGTPVIATDNGMRPRGVRLVRTQDAAALVSAISEVVSGASGADTGIAPTGEENLAAVMNVYERVLVKKRHAP